VCFAVEEDAFGIDSKIGNFWGIGKEKNGIRWAAQSDFL